MRHKLLLLLNDEESLHIFIDIDSREIEEKYAIKTQIKVSDAYEIDQMLGTGSYASVRKVHRVDHCKVPFALKSFNEEVKVKYSEIEILNLIDYPSIPKVIESYKDINNVHIVMQYCDGTSLSEFFYKILDGELSISTEDMMSIFFQICKVVSYIKQKQVIHNDLKPANIVIKKSSKGCLLPYHIDVVDFGVALQQKNNKVSKQIFGSPHYIAPESLDGVYGYHSDVWSIGVMIYFAICHEFPFEYEDEATNDNGDFSKLFNSIKNKKLEFTPKNIWSDISEDIKDLISKMLDKDPSERIKIEKVLTHKAFKNLSELRHKLKLSESENECLRAYNDLTLVQKAFLKYSTKFIPTNKLDELKEKFILHDSHNLGVCNWAYSTSSEESLTSDRDHSLSLSSNSKSSVRHDKEFSYSEYLSAMIAPKLLCSQANINIIFDSISPTLHADELKNKDILKALKLKSDKNQDEIKELNKIFLKSKLIKHRSSETIICKKWLQSFYSKINRNLSS